MFGGKTIDFLKMSDLLEKNIDIDEKNNYIAIWHDESHLNKYINEIIHQDCDFLSHLYHGIEHSNNESTLLKDGYKCIFLHKQRFITNTSKTKDFNNLKSQQNGIIIKNKYNNKK